MSRYIDINSDAVVAQTARLERIRGGLGRAVKRTLNSAALDVKQRTMIEESDKEFEKRKPTFWRARSRVEFAAGSQVDHMRSTVGFVAGTGDKESGHATEDLEQQEHGGAIDKRAFIASDRARTGRGNVRDELTLARIKHSIWDSKNGNVRGKSDKEKFIISALYAKAYGGYVLGNQFKNGNRHLYKVLSVIRVGGNTHVSTQMIYNVQGGRKAKVEATHFMEHASERTAEKMEGMFYREAQRQINSAM
ncbi:MAG: hypothetical protein KF744_09050 [Taibaiella sp.]|nr:hypothetical protein [Taibaiella sp.]